MREGTPQEPSLFLTLQTWVNALEPPDILVFSGKRFIDGRMRILSIQRNEKASEYYP
jgi:hypothetical protein